MSLKNCTNEFSLLWRQYLEFAVRFTVEAVWIVDFSASSLLFSHQISVRLEASFCCLEAEEWDSSLIKSNKKCAKKLFLTVNWLIKYVILVKYRISVSDTPKVAKVHGIHLVKLLSKRKFCLKKTKTIFWLLNPKVLLNLFENHSKCRIWIL